MANEDQPGLVHGDRQSFRFIGNPYQGYQEKRRRDALQRQKAARMLSANRARHLAFQDEQDADSQISVPESLDIAGDTVPGAEDEELVDASLATRDKQHIARLNTRPSKHSSRRKAQQQSGNGGVRAFGLKYGNELMQPEWMTDVPADLATNWLVMPRPEGLRCMLVASRGRTVSWLRNGAPLHRFHSPLPGGSPATAAGCGAAAATAAGGDYCILDCIFHQPNNTYYIQDLLCWRGYALYDCAAEFRRFWLASKLQEEEGMAQALATATAAVAAVGPHVGPQPGQAGQTGAVDGMAADAEMGDGQQHTKTRTDRGQQQQQQGVASVSYRILPLPVHPATLHGLRAAYGSGRLQAPACAAAGAAAAAATLAAAAFGTGSDGPGPGLGPGPPADSPEACGAGAAGVAKAEGGTRSDGDDVDFLRDGLYFLHRHGHYVTGLAASPLALLWKDLGCSRYLVDTDSHGVPLECQLAVLAYRQDRTVATEDEPPVVLGRLPEAFVATMGDKLKPGRLLRFSIRQGGITFHEGRPVGADLHYEGLTSQRRGRADTFSKILFQRMARTAPITITALAARASEATAGAAAMDAGAEGLPGNAGGPPSPGGDGGGDAAMGALRVAGGEAVALRVEGCEDVAMG